MFKSPARFACGAFLCSTLLLSACATPPRSATDIANGCSVFFEQFERAVAAAGVADAGSWRIPGEPQRRTNRVLAKLAEGLQPEPITSAGWQRWLQLSSQLAHERQRIEWQQLSSVTRRALLQTSGSLNGATTLSEWQQRCTTSPVVSKSQLAQPVADDYSLLQRALGLYPITQLGPKLGLAGLRQGYFDDFTKPQAALKSDHPLRRYSSLASAETGGLALLNSEQASVPAADALGLPLTPKQNAPLWSQHAPLWEVETAGNDDRPAGLQWDELRQAAAANIQAPTEYRFATYSWFNGAWRLQLNYQLWFPARSENHAVDILAGRLDGLIWRVTLSSDGTPLVYDSIHPCGCYHLIIPTEGYSANAEAQYWPEPPIVLPAVSVVDRWKLRVSAGEHQLRGMAAATAADHSTASQLAVRPYRDLLQLPAANGKTRSAFRSDGLIHQTDRAERFLLWPMGIRSAGAMRQASRQPVAFVGRRHFDDWNLLNQILESP